MEKFKIDVLALQETECLHQEREQKILSAAGRQYFYTHTGVQKGVGFLLSQKMQPFLSESFQKITSRILRFDWKGDSKTISFFSIYSPIDQNQLSPMSKKNEEFFKSLQKALAKVKKSNIIVLMGDFNCTLRQKHYSPPFVGQFALRNNIPANCPSKTNGDLVTEVAIMYKLRILNTLLKKNLNKLSTYQPIQTITNNDPLELFLHVKDLILTNSSSTKYKVKHVQAIQHTAHHLILFMLDEKKRKVSQKNKARLLYNQPLKRVEGPFVTEKLRDIDPIYPLKVGAVLDHSSALVRKKAEEIDVDLVYETLITSIQMTCKSFPQLPQPKKHWCSQKTASLCKDKNKAWQDFLKPKIKTNCYFTHS